MTDPPSPNLIMNWSLRPATMDDVPALEALIRLSVRTLQAGFYSPAQSEAALGTVFGVDRQLILDGTYFVAIQDDQIVGCGGWSWRRSIYGSDRATEARDDTALDPRHDAARIRACFVHPAWARRGIGRGILIECEAAILRAGFLRAELVGTLAGEALYAACGYHIVERTTLPLSGGDHLPVVRMSRQLRPVISGK